MPKWVCTSRWRILYDVGIRCDYSGGNFQACVSTRVLKHWKTEVAESLCLEIFKTLLDMALINLLSLTVLWTVLDKMSPDVPANLRHSVVLWKYVTQWQCSRSPGPFLPCLFLGLLFYGQIHFYSPPVFIPKLYITCISSLQEWDLCGSKAGLFTSEA